MRELLEISRRGINAAERATAVTAHNISNANTVGYSRQRVDLSPAAYKKNNASIGLGVNIDQVTRLRNEMLDTQIRMKESLIGQFEERSRMLEQIQGIFNSSGGTNLDALIGNLLNAFSELTNNPEDLNRRMNVIRDASQFITRVNSMASQLETLQEQAGSRNSDTLGQVNILLKDIAALNASIMRGNASGTPDNNSLDLQTQKLEALANLVDIDTQTGENGGLEIKIGGIIVIQGDNANSLKGESDPTNNVFRVRLESGTVIKPQGGKLGANLELYQNEIPQYLTDLNFITNVLIDEINGAHRMGYNLNDETGLNFFDPESRGAKFVRISDYIIENANRIAASSVPNAPGNADIAAQISNLRNQRLGDGQTVMEKAITLNSRAGSELYNLYNRMETEKAAQNLLINQQESISGVNIDEELTNLIKFQNAYQASARVLNTAQQMYDSLLSIV